ncbi:glutamate synthase (NADPH) small chain [Nitratiruptor sp. YY08-26]|uniref:glutamate synthase subunit beta n=1 Tax=unclassified Nitratiruptor TaxID=2624044 RepID=UPI0019157B6B|nr:MULTISPECIES: glutamate synthase subunit beta [unclassified Nitratiruptor]BCD61911.1 glutamate synthase (NADPH) small chain [Nitratiruptor sp. YY08-13]BCD65846.1 glutamate synthase (NADPH) small chain [Nitratiruptor sp. YY08-26]
MQNFIFNERIEPKKRAVNERIKDFREIYEIYNPNEAATQADRCVQCGDPYCHNACPLHNFIPHWLKTVAEKDLELAFKISNESSPFPEIMGRVCPQDRLCEGACTLNEGYGAITIGAIETFISEEGFKKGMRPDFCSKKTDKKVAIIGSGPAGLSCATYLLRAGIEPHVFERADRAGGLLTYGIPNFKLDKKVIQRRIDWLIEAGMKLNLNVEVGKSLEFEELLENYDAIFIGIGATKPRRAGIEGENAIGAMMAMDFLTNIQRKIFGDSYDKDKEVKDKRVVVIGGGDTAMDCVRTSIREGAAKAICAYRRDAASMPGSRKEVKNAQEEGAEFIYNVAPTKILTDEENKVIGVEFVKTISTTKDGKRKLEVIKNSEFTIDADVVIFALGFENTPLEFLAKHGIETNDWGAIKINENYETTKPGVYAGGDCYRGAHLVVTASYDGREAAKAIARKLLD